MNVGDVVWINADGQGAVRYPVRFVNRRSVTVFEFLVTPGGRLLGREDSRWYGSDEEGVAWCKDEREAVIALRAAIALGAVPEDRPF